MRVYLQDGYRRIRPETTMATFSNIQDFKENWLKRNEDLAKQFNATQEEAEEVTNQTVNKIASEFKDGDEIIHYSDFGIATKNCEREFILLKRNGEIIKSELIRMS